MRLQRRLTVRTSSWLSARRRVRVTAWGHAWRSSSGRSREKGARQAAGPLLIGRGGSILGGSAFDSIGEGGLPGEGLTVSADVRTCDKNPCPSVAGQRGP